MLENRGKTKLKARRRRTNSFQEFDRLPLKLREWVRNAVLPWSSRSVRRIYKRVISRNGDVEFVLKELERLQELLLSREKLRLKKER